MSHDDGRLFVGSVLGFGAGIYTFLKGFRQYRKYRLVADTPAIHIRSAPMGLVQIRGEARAEQPLTSPVTRTPCYLFKVEVDEWHHDSNHGGEWKHVATDIQSVKFDLQDQSGNVLVDATGAEIDLPAGPVREVRGSGSTSRLNLTAPVGVGSASEEDLLQYIEQARARSVLKMVGKGVSLLSHAAGPGPEERRPSIMNLLNDSGGAAGQTVQTQMVQFMLARQDPTGSLRRMALEIWKHPQGSAEFDAALVRAAEAYARAIPAARGKFDPATIAGQAHQNPQVLSMVAMVAGSLEPQGDPEDEQARQAAIAFQRGHAPEITARLSGGVASGHYRLREFCLLPGHTYDITGTCAENPHPRDEHDRNIILKGTNEPTFLISFRSGAEVQSWLWKQSLWMVLGGAALAVICLAIILGKLGLF